MDSWIELFYFHFFLSFFLFSLSILEHFILKGNRVNLDDQSEEIKVQWLTTSSVQHVWWTNTFTDMISMF